MGKLTAPKNLTWSKAKLENKDQLPLSEGSQFIGMWIEKHRNLKLLVTIDDGMLHLSISHPKRYPTWDEILRTRYKFVDEKMELVMHLPKKSEYVNLHQNCFHLWQMRFEASMEQEPIAELVIEGAT